ncbi:MAG: metallophosphoesterase [Bdellovibrionales bacterium]|jgi:Icc-related predicted phosphoesterase
MTKLTLALVTDIHFGPDRGTKKGSEALLLLDRFGAFVRELNPDVCVEMGDRTSSSRDLAPGVLMKEVCDALRAKIPGEVYHILGNHDLDGLSLEDNEKILGRSLVSRSLDINGFHLVFWNTHPVLDKTKGFTLDMRDLDWLREDLKATTLPVVIFTHVPLDNGSMEGNFYFDKAYPHHAGYPAAQGEAIREVIERSGKVILCVNGHAHWNAYHGIDGTHYVTIPSLVETFPTWPDANEAWARLSIGESIEIGIYGRAPMLYRLPIKKLGAHWCSIEKDYTPNAAKPT